MPRAGCARPSMAAGWLVRSGPGRSGRTSAGRVQIVVHTGPIKLLGVQFGSKWVNVKTHGSKRSQVAPTLCPEWFCKSRTLVSFTLRFQSSVPPSRYDLVVLSPSAICHVKWAVSSQLLRRRQVDKFFDSLATCHVLLSPSLATVPGFGKRHCQPPSRLFFSWITPKASAARCTVR
jgi:hypothetical protein